MAVIQEHSSSLLLIDCKRVEGMHDAALKS